MLGVAEFSPHPPALAAVIGYLKLKLPTVPVSQDVPKKLPDTFVTVDRAGGTEAGSGGLIAVPLLVFGCYALDSGGAEQLSEQVLAVVKSAQFTRYGAVQFRAFDIASLPQDFGDPGQPGRRRWQFSGAFSMNSV